MKQFSLYILTILFFSLSSCTKDFEEINKNPNGPEEVTSQLLLPDVQRDVMGTLLGETWGIGNIVIQHTAKNQFVNEDRYLWGEINGIWNTCYGKMKDVNKIIELGESANDKGTQAVGIIMRAWMFSLLTDTYGDIPYSEAIKAKEGIYYTKYDSQEDIYSGILAELKTANELLAVASGKVGGDLFYGGDLTKWRKLANSLRVRYLIRISSKKSPAAELANILSNPTNNPIFESNSDNAVYLYKSASPDQFPLYSTRSGSFNEFRASKTLLDTLKTLGDPRLTIFFRATPATESTANPEFIGIPNGLDDVTAQTYAGGQQNHSRIGALYYEDAITPKGLSIAMGIVMTYAELQFLLAEAASKSWISGDAATFYNAGITSSFQFYGLSVSQSYLALSQVSLTGNVAEDQKKIGFQKWISFFYQGMEAWYDWRRTRIPALTPAVSNQNGGKIPVRFIYPIIEQALNGSNRSEAVSRQGGDDINTLMWYLK